MIMTLEWQGKILTPTRRSFRIPTLLSGFLGCLLLDFRLLNITRVETSRRNKETATNILIKMYPLTLDILHTCYTFEYNYTVYIFLLTFCLQSSYLDSLHCHIS